MILAASRLPRRCELVSMRIGVFQADDPFSTVVAHVRDRPYSDYFSVDWLPPAPPIKAGHLWRANHLNAGWRVREIRTSLKDAAAEVDSMLHNLAFAQGRVRRAEGMVQSPLEDPAPRLFDEPITSDRDAHIPMRRTAPPKKRSGGGSRFSPETQ